MLGKRRNSSVLLKTKGQQNVSSMNEKAISKTTKRAIEMLETQGVEGKIKEIQESQEVQETQRE